jgi:hypothetical protein
MRVISQKYPVSCYLLYVDAKRADGKCLATAITQSNAPVLILNVVWSPCTGYKYKGMYIHWWCAERPRIFRGMRNNIQVHYFI